MIVSPYATAICTESARSEDVGIPLSAANEPTSLVLGAKQLVSSAHRHRKEERPRKAAGL